MGNNAENTCRSRRGMSRLVAILLICIAVLLVAVSIPAYRYYKAMSDRIGCVQSLDSATRRIAEDYIIQTYGDDEQTVEEVKAVAAKAMLGWDDLCPSYGTVYVVRNDDSEMPYRLVCGLHDPDKAERTRLNAKNLLGQLQDAMERAKLLHDPLPEDFDAALNGKTMTVVRLAEPNDLRRGTSSSVGHKGTEAWYTRDEDGNVAWFVYAEEDYAAVWRAEQGWSGDSYQN